MFKKVLGLTATGLLAVALTACGGNEAPEETDAPANEEVEQTDEQASDLNTEDLPETIATVNGEDITNEIYQAQIQQFMMVYQMQGLDLEAQDEDGQMTQMIHQQALDSLIADRLLVQAANEQGIEVDEEEVETQLNQVTAQFETEEELNEALEQENITMDELREDITNQLKRLQFEEEIAGDVTVSEEEIRDAYDELVAAHGDEVPEFDEYQPQLEQQIKDERSHERIAAYVDELREEGEVEIYI
ncbi:SurA N-terminal domain-containing protein [Desertibacillus haloalkaliphilus]|uniref:SurA N-terminal domain-containing protein n=1 Tax=Desertibacillus haloalkaliphilus TaxID=1328930 RepID=UPI001C272133|nr:SurA N-terminal domain-containing protein [Desertibacillus haloalkaliphilus]MBU8907457.1 SurA N-terminal domain-containing protein [Desertibacillus haloalkaliphilus]